MNELSKQAPPVRLSSISSEVQVTFFRNSYPFVTAHCDGAQCLPQSIQMELNILSLTHEIWLVVKVS
jgi:hypothetical protein